MNAWLVSNPRKSPRSQFGFAQNGLNGRLKESPNVTTAQRHES